MNDTEFTARAFFVKWLQVIQAKRKPKTYECYASTLERYVPDTLKNQPLASVTPLDIESVLLALQDKSPRIRQLTHAVLRAAFKQAVGWRLISSNPVDGVEAPRVPKKKLAVWTPMELRRFLDHVRAQNDRFLLLYELAAETGWREGELLGLMDTDLNEANELTCSRTLTEINGLFSYGSPKTESGKRTITLSANLANKIRTSGRGLLFRTREGTPVSKSNFYKKFQQRVKEVGVPRIRFHDIRHTNATILLNSKVSARTVADRLGHSDPGTTLSLYGHFTKEGDVMAMNAMVEVMKCAQ
jgi:integrase